MKCVLPVFIILTLIVTSTAQAHRFYATRTGNGSCGSYGSSTDETSSLNQPTFRFTVQTGQGSLQNFQFRQPVDRLQQSVYQLDRMKPEHFVAFFRQNQWTGNQILSNPTWYIYDNYVVVAKQCPGYTAYINKYYEEYKDYGFVSKGLGRITNTYTPGLADRFTYLKRENDICVERQRDLQRRQEYLQEQQEAWRTVKHTFETQECSLEAVFRDCGIVSQEEDDPDYYAILNRNNRCIKREDAFE